MIFLTGDEAKKEWVKRHPEYPDGPDNDYMIINDNPKLRTLPIADPVVVKIIDQAAPLPEPVTGSLGDLTPPLSPNPFWITVAHGKITMIEEQFLP